MAGQNDRYAGVLERAKKNRFFNITNLRNDYRQIREVESGLNTLRKRAYTLAKDADKHRRDGMSDASSMAGHVSEYYDVIEQKQRELGMMYRRFAEDVRYHEQRQMKRKNA